MDPSDISKFLESCMLVAFGFAWPANILHTLRHKSTQGKSLLFLLIVFVGYMFGIGAKVLGDTINYVLFFYLANIIMVGIDTCLYFYYWNKQRERFVAGRS
ncbi:MAG: hypothetical protein LBR80_05485 [Deltaproteobacteria bacterium]|jgi:lipopolysaccharide export LptBFGC system permease protein LptF|nr:hypothetical protein [Deltaproteobacteria bacterium]